MPGAPPEQPGSMGEAALFPCAGAPRCQGSSRWWSCFLLLLGFGGWGWGCHVCPQHPPGLGDALGAAGRAAAAPGRGLLPARQGQAEHPAQLRRGVRLRGTEGKAGSGGALEITAVLDDSVKKRTYTMRRTQSKWEADAPPSRPPAGRFASARSYFAVEGVWGSPPACRPHKSP